MRTLTALFDIPASVRSHIHYHELLAALSIIVGSFAVYFSLISVGVNCQGLLRGHTAELGQGNEREASRTGALSTDAVAWADMGARRAVSWVEQTRGVGAKGARTADCLSIQIALGGVGGLEAARRSTSQGRWVALMTKSSNNVSGLLRARVHGDSEGSDCSRIFGH